MTTPFDLGRAYWRDENGALAGMGIMPEFPEWYGKDDARTFDFNRGYCAEMGRADEPAAEIEAKRKEGGQ